MKTGLTVGPGGATGLYGVTPDLVAWPRRWAAASRPPRSAARDEVMALIADGSYEQVGTFNGNPLAMAAGPGEADRGADAGGVRPPGAAARSGWPPGSSRSSIGARRCRGT